MPYSLSRRNLKAHQASPEKETRDGPTSNSPTKPQGSRDRRNHMNDELLTMIEREVLGCPGVSKPNQDQETNPLDLNSG